MDLSHIKGMLETNDSLEVDDNDLEDELNAILSGQPTTSSAANVKRVKQTDVKQTKSGKTSRSDVKKVVDNDSDFMFSNDMLNIEKLGIIGDIDDGDDDDIDEDNEELLSEINFIASNTSGHKSAHQTRHSQPQHRDDQFGALRETPSQYERPGISPQIPERTSSLVTPSASNAIPRAPEPTANRSPLKPEPSVGVVRSQALETKVDTKDDNKTEIPRLTALRDEYKRAALTAKKAGQQTNALSHIRTAKQIEVLIKSLEEGLSVDLSHLPPPPLPIGPPTTAQNAVQTSSPSAEALPQNNTNEEIGFDIDLQNVELTTEDAKKFFNAPPPPNSVIEALDQRLAKFKSTLEQAKGENNTSKVRRLGRIVKQYENAIKDHKKGTQVDFESLPAPPGFGPIPVGDAAKPVSNTPVETKSPPKQVKTPTKPTENTTTNVNKSPQTAGATGPTPPKVATKPNLKRASSVANKQLNYLLERQRLFKEAALESKQKGDIQQAKEYLRMAKGFEPLIEATQNGLPIDATSIPTPPQMSDDFVIVSHPDASEGDDLEKEEMYRKIEMELQNQFEMCKRNKEYFLQLGDVSTASKFEKYAIDSRRDLDMLTVRWRAGQKVPHFRYETRTFSIVICNTEVGTNEVSVEVVKGLDIPGKSDIDTYVRIEFPFPNDRQQTARTRTVKNTTNPVFNETFRFEIDRKSRQLPRVFKRHPIKLELMSKGGFLRSDVLIGTALIKVVDFESKCTIHDSFPLTEGRKTVGGKVEARIRIREPLLAKQVEEVKEKWLVFD